MSSSSSHRSYHHDHHHHFTSIYPNLFYHRALPNRILVGELYRQLGDWDEREGKRGGHQRQRGRGAEREREMAI